MSKLDEALAKVDGLRADSVALAKRADGLINIKRPAISSGRAVEVEKSTPEESKIMAEIRHTMATGQTSGVKGPKTMAGNNPMGRHYERKER